MTDADSSAPAGDPGPSGVAASEAPAPDPGEVELPEPVRARLAQRACEVLPAVPSLPPQLRQVAAFAPQRRARLGGGRVVAVLRTDPGLRARVLQQLLASPQVAAVETEGALDDHDPLDVAVLAWLRGDDAWHPRFEAALERHRARAGAGALARSQDALERAERRVAVLEDELRAAREQVDARLDELRAENTLLRGRLGEARTRAREAEQGAERTQAETARDAERHAVAEREAQAEVRRLRRQLDEAQTLAASRRAEGRSEREEASVRTRLLLETLVRSAQGLQRELGLAASREPTPGERAESALTAADGQRVTSAAGALGPGSPVLLEQLASLPRARVLVDGYNVTKQAWGSSSLEVQRLRLLNGLAPYAARWGAETTVVFDGAGSSARPVVAAPRGLRVVFSPEQVIADDLIRDLVALEPAGRPVVVVTSDQELARDVRRAGARVMDAVALSGLLARA